MKKSVALVFMVCLALFSGYAMGGISEAKPIQTGEPGYMEEFRNMSALGKVGLGFWDPVIYQHIVAVDGSLLASFHFVEMKYYPLDRQIAFGIEVKTPSTGWKRAIGYEKRSIGPFYNFEIYNQGGVKATLKNFVINSAKSGTWYDNFIFSADLYVEGMPYIGYWGEEGGTGGGTPPEDTVTVRLQGMNNYLGPRVTILSVDSTKLAQIKDLRYNNPEDDYTSYFNAPGRVIKTAGYWDYKLDKPSTSSEIYYYRFTVLYPARGTKYYIVEVYNDGRALPKYTGWDPTVR